MTGLILLLELAALYVLSRFLTQKLYAFFLLLFQSRPVALSFTTAVLFPGTVIHELGHLFTAEVLGVHTGKLTLVPESLEDGEVRSGSVMIAQSDPFRRYAIGLAPVLAGLLGLTALSFWLPDLSNKIFNAPVPFYQNIDSLYLLLVTYLIFAVSNSMFSSPEDLKGFTGFAIVVGLLVAGGYIAGIRIGLTGQALVFIQKIGDSLMKSTGIVLAINAFLLLVLYLNTIFFQNILKRRVILK